MIKVKTSISNCRNMDVLFGISSKQLTLKFDENCEAEIHESDVEELILIHNQISKVKKESEPQVKEDLSEDLNLLSIEDLKSMAKEAKFSKKEYEKLSKEELIDYLNKKQ